MFADRTDWDLTPNRLSEALARHRAAGRPLLDLTASNPTTCGFDYDQQAILGALANPGALRYAPDPKGLESARKAVCAYYAERGDEIGADDLILTSSTSEAYSFVFRTICNPGDEVLVPEPSYPLFGYLAGLQDVKLVRYPLVYERGWQIDIPALERAMTARTRGVIVVHPNNPTGHFCKPEEAARLSEMCSARPMALIADEVFLDFALGEKRALSFAANAGALTFTLSGLSKISGLPQMKAAWVVVGGLEPLKTPALARLEVIADTFLSVNTPAQLALPVFLEQRHAFRQQLMTRVRRNLGELDRQLAGCQSCNRLELEGGWYAVLRVPATRSDEALAIELLRSKGVYVHPGHFYDFPVEGYLVASLIVREREFGEGIRRIVSMF